MKKILSYFKGNSRKLYKNYVESKLIKQDMDREVEGKVGGVE